MVEKYSLNKITLKFKDEHLDELYNESFYQESLKLMRFASFFALILYILFGIPDILFYDNDRFLYLIIRYLIVVPILITVFGLTFTPFFRKRGQIIFSITILITGISVLITAFSEIPFSLHFIGMILVFIFCYNFSRLLFKYAIITSLVILGAYVALALWTAFFKNSATALTPLTFYFILYLALNITGIISNYAIEKLNKKAFVQQIIINNRNSELEEKNSELSNRNQLISDQNIELNDLNKKLSEVNYEISLQYQELEDLAFKQKILNQEIISSNNKLNSLNNELKSANNTKDKFFSIIAHDLKNPLTSIILSSEIAHRYFNKLTEQEKFDSIGKLHIAAKNLYSLLENLLTWARNQSGKIEFDPVNIHVQSLLDEVIGLLKNMANEKNIEIIYHSAIVQYVYADKNMLAAIFRNLISNALKFTPGGGIIEIGSINRVDPNNSDLSDSFIAFYVKDTGTGMPSETVSKLFRYDQNVSMTGTSGEKGTGLGLILCKEFAEKHGGNIWAESILDKGSAFYFTLPKLK